MKIILLPGLDGTGEMFSPILPALSDHETQIVKLPNTGNQDYDRLCEFVSGKLPDEDHIIVAESFSGPIAAKLAVQNNNNIKGVVFVATFLKPPRKFLIGISKALPVKLLAKLPLAKYFKKELFLGKDANDELVMLFRETINSLDSKLIRDRLKSLESLDVSITECGTSSIYLQATNDKLVPDKHSLEFEKLFTQLKVKRIVGPHFLLQAKSQECADEIRKFIDDIPLNPTLP